MCAMALLHRAKALSKYKQSHEGSSKSGQGLAQDTQLPAHVRMPANFIGRPLSVMCSVCAVNPVMVYGWATYPVALGACS